MCKCLTFIVLFLGFSTTSVAERPIVIAHRGASGYLPEHTLEAASMAHAMGADYIEQDVVLTKDDVPVVLHDIHLDTVTDVAERFPNRARKDGRFYAIDFTLAELKTLAVNERISLKTMKVVYPKRFPFKKANFEVPTLAEEIQLIHGLNKSSGRTAGLYVEVKSPAWHRQEGKDISRITLGMLAEFGYRTKSDLIYVQCFDAAETKRMRTELKTALRLVQLIGENRWKEAPTDFDALRTVAGIEQIATYADGIGPRLTHVIGKRSPEGDFQGTELVTKAHAAGLLVHPYTARADSLPKHVKNFKQLLGLVLSDAGVDGMFTDFPDRVIQFRAKHFDCE